MLRFLVSGKLMLSVISVKEEAEHGWEISCRIEEKFHVGFLGQWECKCSLVNFLSRVYKIDHKNSHSLYYLPLSS